MIPLLVEILGDIDYAFKGASPSGHPMLTIVNDRRVYLGHSLRGAPLYTINGNTLYKGYAVSGAPLATLLGNLVFYKNNVSGIPIATIRNNLVFKGNAQSGIPLATALKTNPITLFVAAYHILHG